MSNYYNEIDKFAAKWLRNLIAAGYLPPGDVDERSIEDIIPYEIKNYTQHHFFAGIGGWSLALRLAGWEDDRRVATGSCPCQPFSAAGKGLGFADERHLWPTFFHLIRELGFAKIYGEQVADGSGLDWLDIVQSDLEAAGYATAAIDLCAASVGAPHIRQRLFFVADIDITGASRFTEFCGPTATGMGNRSSNGGGIGIMVNASDTRLQERERERGIFGGASGTIKREASIGTSIHSGELGIADSDGCLPGSETTQAAGFRYPDVATSRNDRVKSAAPTNGFWRNADWLGCTDGKFRPVEPGTFPLAHGISNRVGKLRGYGNAIVPQLAAEFIKATM